jgi:8-oxo-dGTP diphosphatase
MYSNLALFRVFVGVVLINSQGQVLLLKRAMTGSDLDGNWELPAGHLNKYESLEEGLKREVIEETGIASFQIKDNLRVFEIPSLVGDDSSFSRLGIVYWAITDIDEVILSDEHTDYKWLNPTEAKEMATLKGIKLEIQLYIDRVLNQE